MFIDIHAHLNKAELLENAEEIIARAKAVGVEKIVCVGYDYDTSSAAVDLSKKYKEIYAAVGIHPHHCFEFDDKMEKLILSAKDNKKIVAIGEIGLDYYNLDYQTQQAKAKNLKLKEITTDDMVKKQKQIFLKQLALANQTGLPIMIHMRDSASDTLKIMEGNKLLLSNSGLLHCYSGSVETANRFFDLGFYISVGGAITFKNSRNMPAVLREIGLKKITLETDCPFLAPEPYRGKRNEPANIPLIAKKISEILELKIEEVEKITTENCYRVFSRLKQVR